MRKILCAAFVAAALSAPAHARAEEPNIEIVDVVELEPPTIPTQLLTPSTLITDGGSGMRLPAGFWIWPDSEHKRVDGELRTLQEHKTRVDAENQSLRRSIHENTTSARIWIGTMLLVGFSAGYAYHRWGN